MTLAEIFSRVASIYLKGIMFHSDMARYFDFLNLSGYKKMHEHEFYAQNKKYMKLQGYYTEHYQKLLPDPNLTGETVIPANWYNYKRSDVNAADKKNAVKLAFTKWIEWEHHVKHELTECVKALREADEYAAACEIEQELCDLSEEIKRAECMNITLKSRDYPLDYIDDIQAALCEKYKK